MLPSRLEKDRLEAGCDEAGRGCLAGPVFAAAVILPADFQHENLKDSKLLDESQRKAMSILIRKSAIAYAISFCSPSKIDRVNILNASFAAMHAAIKRLKPAPEHLLIDGNRFNPLGTFSFDCIIKGDGKIGSIAAASILAKTARDAYMLRKHKLHPEYQWITNKGYPTAAHRQAIQEHGLTPLHRLSFKQLPNPDQLILPF
ncbi:MAG: ribonuclease HII [Saprospiraceae bacterium]|nr:ribonuclease HII [Saprospiraceae bacterium]